MELDTFSLRAAFAVCALTMLLLFYFVTFRSTRSPYSGWWCLALTWFLSGSAAFLFNGTQVQRWANPLGSMLLVLGVTSAWAATRSLSGRPTRTWQILAAPALTVAVALMDDPATDVWAGGGVFLAMMSLMLGLSARELWRLDGRLTQVRTPVAAAATLICGYYVLRWCAFLVDGPNGDVFTQLLGTQVTTMISLVFLVTISFSMSVLSNEQATRDLRIRATQDGLTGLLNREEFLIRAADELRSTRRSGAHAALILADLDHFKLTNDSYGHAAGDRALQAFADAASRTVRASDLVARYGGEEFILLLPDTTLDRAEQITVEISALLSALQTTVGFPMPTVSYGIASADPATSLGASVASADAAMYRAKTLGRNRAVRERNYADSGVDPTDMHPSPGGHNVLLDPPPDDQH